MNSSIKISTNSSRHKLYLTTKLSLWVKLLLIIEVCTAYSVYASTEFKYSGDKKIETVIGANELNRIGIIGGEIIEIIGDENKYALYWSGDWRNLFIKPKVEVGEIIELSLIMPQGEVQDMRFTVGDTTSQTIFINLGNMVRAISSSPVSGCFHPLSDPKLKSEIASMMRAMIEGEKGKYYVMSVKRILKQNKQQLVTQNGAYRYRDLSGALLEVKNLTSKSLDLLELDFKNLFKSTVAINLKSCVIRPRATMQVFIITRETHHD